MKKKILALALSLTLLLTPALAFSDVPDTAMSLAAETLSGMGIVSGDGDGNYYPDQTLTRAQFCKMAVLAEGHGDQVGASAYKTLFSDVPSGNWAAPYVNLAYQEKLIAGYGNGLFGPDDGITVSQAVTIALHLLGYENSDIGPFWPEDYMAKGADLGLLDGVSGTADTPMTRGEAALLLYNLLGMNTAQGKPFYEGLGATAITNAVLLDGTEITVYANNAITDYTAVSVLPEALVGERGTLLLDKSGRAVGFLPDSNLRKTVTVSTIDGSALGGIAVANATPLILDEERLTWESGWYDLRAGDRVVVYYNAAGAVDLLWVKTRTAGTVSTLTGYYEDASPNTAAPSTIAVLGASLTVTDLGCAALKGYAIGDKITVTLNADGKVTDVAHAASSTVRMVGVLTSATTDRAEVALTGGITVSGKPYSTISSALTGNLVQVSAAESGKLSVSSLTYTPSAVALDGLTLAEDVKVYERVNGSVLTEIDPDDVPAETPAASILHAGANGEGEVNLLVLADVTGACYTYGILNKGEKTGGSGTLQYTNTTVAVENNTGKSTAYVTGLNFTDGTVGGVAGNAEGKAAAIVTLTAKENLTRADFSGSDAVGGMPLADDVQVYNAVTGKWVTLSAAKGFTNSFTAYYDTHGIVRVIFAE